MAPMAVAVAGPGGQRAGEPWAQLEGHGRILRLGRQTMGFRTIILGERGWVLGWRSTRPAHRNGACPCGF